ncbi:MAG: hypothetical protein EA417_05815 [Gammaproteobacteria bacterium]|nr:MAG: hypothetical protein EA417_05815 [Gammaproteobacteria bacterium]
MPLENALIDPARLPPATPLRLIPVAPSFAPYRVLSLFWRWAMFVIVLLAFALPSLDEAPPASAYGPLVLLLLIAMHLTLAWREARARGWGLRENDLLYASGLFWRRLTVLPCNRIQHVETASGPMERAFGLLRVTCFTAGGLSADLVLQGIAKEDAERVRQHLLSRVHELEGETAEQPENTSADASFEPSNSEPRAS